MSQARNPQDQFTACGQIWADALRAGHTEIVAAKLDHGPWIETLLETAGRLANLRAPAPYVADVLDLVANGIRQRNDLPERPISAELPPVMAASTLFLDAMRVAMRQASYRQISTEEALAGLMHGLVGFLTARLGAGAAADHLAAAHAFLASHPADWRGPPIQ